MKKYKKMIILASILVVLIVLIVVVMTQDFNLFIFKNYSVAGVSNKKEDVETLKTTEDSEKDNLDQAKQNLQNAKNNFDVQKEQYESIDESTITAVEQATIDEKYFIEYLWISLENYAVDNNLEINIITPGSTGTSGSQAASSDRVKIVVLGRYSDVADFVFNVENDISLKFKLDNISMAYSSNNKIQATFDVLSLSVLN